MDEQEKKFREILGIITEDKMAVSNNPAGLVAAKEKKAKGVRNNLSLPTELWAKLYALSFHQSMTSGGRKVSMVDVISDMLEHYLNTRFPEAREFVEKYSR